MDCLDNLKTRFVVEAAARAEGIPMVSAAVAGETGHVTAVFPGDAGLAAIHGPPEKTEDKGVERSLGSPPHSVSLLSALESAEVFKVLLGRDGILRDRLLIVDLSDYTFQTVELGQPA
jgi:molybdopterin/thiamine biosynthesis adenylyltransferase